MPNPMTVEGAKALRDELEHLKRVVRPEISKAIGVAREHGDLKENAEYHAAKDQQGMSEARVREIESRLADAQVIDVSKIAHTGKVVFGATITLIDCDEGTERRFRIVGEDEADIKIGKISVMSPLARALVGKSEGDVVNVETPGGDAEYEIEKVEHIAEG